MGRKKPRNIDDFFVLNAPQIARESAAIILQHLCFFTSIAVLLLCPVSAALLISRALLPGNILVAKFALQIREGGIAAGFPNSNYTQIICGKLSETIICYALCFPFILTFSLFARAAVAHTVSCIYAGNKLSFQRLVEAIPALWKPLVLTYLWAGVAMLGANAGILVVLSGVMKGLHVLGFQWEIGVALGGGIAYSLVFAHAMIVCNLAWVVSVMEEGNLGMEAVLRAMFLIRGRTRIALVMAVFINLGWAFVESLFGYRVMGRNRNGGVVGKLNMAWEGPLLVFMYSMLSLMDAVMSTVFYYTCRSSRVEGACLGACRCVPRCLIHRESEFYQGGEQQGVKEKSVANHRKIAGETIFHGLSEKNKLPDDISVVIIASEKS